MAKSSKNRCMCIILRAYFILVTFSSSLKTDILCLAILYDITYNLSQFVIRNHEYCKFPI